MNETQEDFVTFTSSDDHTFRDGPTIVVEEPSANIIHQVEETRQDKDEAHVLALEKTCLFCNYVFANLNDLRTHLVVKHHAQPSSKISCLLCSFKAEKPFVIKAHLVQEHGAKIKVQRKRKKIFQGQMQRKQPLQPQQQQQQQQVALVPVIHLEEASPSSKENLKRFKIDKRIYEDDSFADGFDPAQLLQNVKLEVLEANLYVESSERSHPKKSNNVSSSGSFTLTTVKPTVAPNSSNPDLEPVRIAKDVFQCAFKFRF